MIDSNTIAGRVLDSLVNAGLLTVEQLADVDKEAHSRSVSIGAVLTEHGFVSGADVSSVLEHEMGVPQVDLSSYAPEDTALALVPAEIARSRRVLPLFEIEGMLTAAIGDPMDVFVLDEVGQQLNIEIEPVLADSASVLGALVQYYGEEAAGAEATGEVAEELPISASDFFEESTDGGPQVPVVPSETPQAGEAVPTESLEEVVTRATEEEGAPSIDLDVLAVADAGKVAVLVQDILETAVRRGATKIHVLPYKDDFFLVYRVKGRLEKVGSASLGMEAALIDGFKSFVRLQTVPASTPALGRMRAKVADKDLVLGVSSVPTVSGQRMVISISPAKPMPRGLAELGMSETEVKALHAMVERGRGILLVCAPVAGGRSATYYALLAHAAAAGKAAYSVEASVEYEIPAVAQVMVSAGSVTPTSAYIAAGLRQDTDVVAIDEIASVEDVHLAIEAAGLGKLVIATFAAGDIVTGVRRMLDLGVEPHSLASALTLGVGQRLVRTNCPNCLQEKKSPIADKIPGAPKGLASKTGTGCPNCNKTGFRGVTGIFEVLPFTEPVRTSVARGGTAEQMAAAASAAGMRPLSVSGLAKVKEGLVSAEELNRVLRFAD